MNATGPRTSTPNRLSNRGVRLRIWRQGGVSRATLLLTGVLVLSLSGCFLFGPPERTPSVVGVIVSKENSNGAWVFHLQGGDIVEVDFRETDTVRRSSGGADPGTLLFYGDGDGPWSFTLRAPHPPEHAFQLDVAARDDDTHIVFENGLRLPKAPGFDGRGWPRDGRYDSPTWETGFAPFCINERGEVTGYLAMPSDRREGCPEG